MTQTPQATQATTAAGHILVFDPSQTPNGPTAEATQVAAPAAPAEIVAPSQAERRASKRFPCQGTAQVIVLGGALTFQGQVQNLSATGCCVTTDVTFTLERGTQVEIVMVVNNIHFRVVGGVRSNHKVRGVGLEFMNVSPRCARYIRDLIAELEAKQAAENPETA